VSFACAPRIDDRLRRFIAGSAGSGSAASITRAAGELAWQLDLPRPSYEQVRIIVRAAEPTGAAPAEPIDPVRLLAGAVGKTLDFLYQYPGPGLDEWYRRYKRGEV
jgi:hypothetical protein